MRTNVRLRGIVCVLFIVLGFYTMKGQSFYYYYNNQKMVQDNFTKELSL